MRWIKYKQIVGKKADGSDVVQEMTAEYSESNLLVVKGLAFGDPEITPDDGQPIPEKVVSTDEIVNILLGVSK